MLLDLADLTVDTAEKAVYRAGERIWLSRLEYRLFEYLLTNSGEVVSRDQIDRHVFQRSTVERSNIIDVYVGYLRTKLGHRQLIAAQRGKGYLIKGPVQARSTAE
jgi:two-component system, OmpR family, response regulator